MASAGVRHELPTRLVIAVVVENPAESWRRRCFHAASIHQGLVIVLTSRYLLTPTLDIDTHPEPNRAAAVLLACATTSRTPAGRQLRCLCWCSGIRGCGGRAAAQVHAAARARYSPPPPFDAIPCGSRFNLPLPPLSHAPAGAVQADDERMRCEGAVGKEQ
ncbi:hypothetical protein GALMADRAFT_137458 [Galerina marginata CBS 339.88]|uniref:Uncharacterized protein n=1 Tax=Galerina marginata (strain CBS 339.88) TaxID=685588 RepID=A0A067T945_GALM3|nr:hypothetical protein GALMADRAFT_137458 [Galerina marginata CBS 339.88]